MSEVTLPQVATIRRMFTVLLDRDVAIATTDPVMAADLPTTLVALYVDDTGRLSAVQGLDLPLAAYSSAALGLMPATVAHESVEDEGLSPSLAENVAEVCNILTGLLNREDGPHLRLHQVCLPGQAVPPDAAAHLLALGRRLDVEIGIPRYGSGKLTVALVG